MFDQLQAYSGAMVSPAGEEGIVASQAEPVFKEPTTPEEILDHARQEAEKILAEAHEQANQIIADKLDEAGDFVELSVAEKVDEASNTLRLDLWSSRLALAEIVDSALRQMIGKLGQSEATLAAVTTAIETYCDKHTPTVYASDTTANRLELIGVAARDKLSLPAFHLKRDPALEEGRVILDTGRGRFEVSLEAQMQAMRKLSQSTALDMEQVQHKNTDQAGDQ